MGMLRSCDIITEGNIFVLFWRSVGYIIINVYHLLCTLCLFCTGLTWCSSYSSILTTHYCPSLLATCYCFGNWPLFLCYNLHFIPMLYLTLNFCVSGPPTQSGPVNSRYVAELGKTIKLECPVDGEQSSLTVWKKNGQELRIPWDRFKVFIFCFVFIFVVWN